MWIRLMVHCCCGFCGWCELLMCGLGQFDDCDAFDLVWLLLMKSVAVSFVYNDWI